MKLHERDDESDDVLYVQDRGECESFDADRHLTRRNHDAGISILLQCSCAMSFQSRHLSEIDVLGIERCKEVVTK